MLTIPVRLLAALVVMGAASLGFVRSAAAADQVGFAYSLRLLKSGKDVPRAIRSLEALSSNGDVAARFVLGAVYIEGKFLPRNRPLGLAYLKVAVAEESASWPEVYERAQGMIDRVEAEMTSDEIRETAQHVERLQAEIAEISNANVAAAVRYFTAETPVALEPVVAFAVEPVALVPGRAGAESIRFRRGCGVDTGADCRDLVGNAEAPRCSGEIHALDTSPSQAAGEGVIAPRMKLPLSARQLREEGTMRLLVHVDGTGWVCGAAVAGSSGVPALDDAALDAIGKSRFRPGSRDGIPSEALKVIRFTYRLDLP
jgi:TonB family protein